MEAHTRESRDLADVLGAVAIYGPTSFGFAGGAPLPVPPGAAPETALTEALQQTIYAEAYTRRLRSAWRPPEPEPAQGEDEPFRRALSEANAGRERWDGGWSVYQLGPNGQAFVQKGDRHRAPQPGEFVLDGEPPTRVGSTVRLRVPTESWQRQPGFYFAFGETPADVFDDVQTVRLYFHATGGVAPELVRHLTAALNRYRVPFQLKTLAHPAQYTRTDPTVLYVARRHAPCVLDLVAGFPDAVLGGLRPDVPLFAKRLRDGIGVAEEPGTGESFGMHRCRLVAEAVVEAWQQGTQEVRARLAMTRARFESYGLDLDRPYLNAGSTDFYTWPTPVALSA